MSTPTSFMTYNMTHIMGCMNSTKTCNSVKFYFMKNSFCDVSRKKILPNVIRAVPALIIFGKIHFQSIPGKEIFMK